MKQFPYDKFKSIFMLEIKALFFHFIEQNRDKKPYAFVLVPRKCAVANDAGIFSDFEFYSLAANGNTIVDFELHKNTLSTRDSLDDTIKIYTDFASEHPDLADTVASLLRREEREFELAASGYSFSNPEGDGLMYKYSSEEWSNDAFTSNDFPKTNLIIGNYILENNDKADFIDEEGEYTDIFVQFETEFLNFLISCLKQLRAEKYFESVYPERIFINFEVWEHYSNEEMVRIFEELNSKEEAKEFARWMLGDDQPETDA